MWYFNLFEKQIDIPQPGAAIFGPVASINDEFMRFATIKKYNEAFELCFKFVILLDGNKVSNITEDNFARAKVAIPHTVDELLDIAEVFPAGIYYFADMLIKIIDNPVYSVFRRIAAIHVNSYFSSADPNVADFIRDDENLPIIMQHIHEMYEECALVCKYHKKNNWSDFHTQLFDTDEEIFDDVNRAETDRPDHCDETLVQH